MTDKQNKIMLYTPYGLNELGGRDNNEDSISPVKGEATGSDRLYLVCDGVGGLSKGEVASSILCNAIPEYLGRLRSSEVSNDDILNALSFAEDKMNEHIKLHPECKKMASTLTLLYFNKQSAAVLWAGDSRIYQIRNGEIIFKSKDHSLVNHLIDIGEITTEEAETHSQKNMILKAVKGGDDKVNPSINELTNIKDNDYFFLCTDGVLENVNDDKLKKLCSENLSCKEINDRINTECYGKTKDNFSSYIIQVEKGSKKVLDNKKSWFNKFNPFILISAILSIIILISLLIFLRKDVNNQKDITIIENKIPKEKVKPEKTEELELVKSEKLIDENQELVDKNVIVEEKDAGKGERAKVESKAQDDIETEIQDVDIEVSNKLEEEADTILNSVQQNDSVPNLNE